MVELLLSLGVLGLGVYLLLPPGAEIQLAGISVPAPVLVLVAACILVFLLGVSLGYRRGRKKRGMFS